MLTCYCVEEKIAYGEKKSSLGSQIFIMQLDSPRLYWEQSVEINHLKMQHKCLQYKGHTQAFL